MRVQWSRLRPLGGPVPTVTVVVPCYNYGRFLPACVRSVLDQRGVDVRIHIIDDASTDQSHAIATRLAAGDARVALTRHDSNQGHIATYNEGLALVGTDYVVLLSADDMLAPGALHRATSLMESNPEVGLVYGHPVEFQGEPPAAHEKSLSWTIWPGRSWIRAQFHRGLSIIYCPEAVVRASVQHRVGYYRPELPHSGDLEMWLRIAAVSDVGRVNGADQALRRVHPESMMRTRYATVAKDLRERQQAYMSFLASSNLPSRDQQRLWRNVTRRQCEEAFDWALREMADPHASADDVSAAVEYATSSYEEFGDLRVWRSYQARLKGVGAANLRESVFATYDCLNRDIRNRIRWQTWRRYGI